MINGALLHLSLNHIPVIGFPLCFFLLLGGNLRRSRDLVQAGYVGLIFIAILTLPTFLSGDSAAHLLRGNPDVVRQTIREHDEAAGFGAVSAGILGVLAFAGWWLSRRNEGAPKAILVAALVGTLFVSVVMGRVAHLGGLIRHPEIDADPDAPAKMMQRLPPVTPAQ